MNPVNFSGYWFVSIAFPNWLDWKSEMIVETETQTVHTRAVCPSGYGGGAYVWDETNSPRTMVVICSRSGNSCPANSTPDQPTSPTSCTCDTGYQPDSTKTSCVQPQCVAPNVIDPKTGKCGPPPCTAIDAIPDLPELMTRIMHARNLWIRVPEMDVDGACPPLNAKLTVWNGEMKVFG